LDLFDNPVGYLTSLAISRPDTPFWGCEIAFFSGSCLITEVIKQLYYIKSGIFGQKSSSYVIGFSEALKEIIIIPVNSDVDEAGSAVSLKIESMFK
jgi:hypothetical protein